MSTLELPQTLGFEEEGVKYLKDYFAPVYWCRPQPEYIALVFLPDCGEETQMIVALKPYRADWSFEQHLYAIPNLDRQRGVTSHIQALAVIHDMIARQRALMEPGK